MIAENYTSLSGMREDSSVNQIENNMKIKITGYDTSTSLFSKHTR
jgi:hypothetical protein